MAQHYRQRWQQHSLEIKILREASEPPLLPYRTYSRIGVGFEAGYRPV